MLNNASYSRSYFDKKYEYRHVTVPQVRLLQTRPILKNEHQLRLLGITMEGWHGWVHYGYYEPDKLLFKRPVDEETPRTQELRRIGEWEKDRKKVNIVMDYEKYFESD